MRKLIITCLAISSVTAFADGVEFNQIEGLVNKPSTKACLCSGKNHVGYLSYEKDITYSNAEKDLVRGVTATCKIVSETNKELQKCYSFTVIDSF